jgi:2-polyprenyl-6-methoxyphenol hydroxylase-like FAD-dependent oxidoreductase
MTSVKRAHAVVIGGSIAGLCTVRALSRHFERVTLVERDHFPDGPEHRAGTPQSHHVHAFLLRGLLELEKLFPGIESDLRAGGARPLDIALEIAHCTEWGWARRGLTGVAPLALSRRLIEHTIRSRVKREVSNLAICEGTRTTGFTTRAEGSRLRVTGITTAGAQQREISADLVVDASGRNSKCLDWLEAHGVTRPEEELVDSYSGYASRFYELAPDPKRWWRGMLIDGWKGHYKHWGLLMPIENGQHVLTLGGVNGAYPPHDEPGFIAHMDTLMSPALAHEIARAKPLSGIHSNRSLFNRARHFERWKHEVAGLVTLGDSAIAYNPYHGQGMSMAACSANLLGDVLGSRDGSDDYRLTRRFHKAQWKELRNAWNIATNLDMEWPGTLGKRPFAYDLQYDLGVAVVRAAAEYPEIKRLLGPVYQLIARPNTLFTPELVLRVLYAELRRRFGGPLLLAAPADTSTVLPALAGDSGSLAID